ncbi:hypothetical protein CY0110_03084 [Crocosphaera chwakensis CCY0110]|uniref:Uncharacterized protein n=2 Tax=Crocosphaera TaxID=263510 RepID=A3IK30_9CHRO|nr:hypothetical protein CY0110_03084 [Crocosphaera chwakensis CCY0110]
MLNGEWWYWWEGDDPHTAEIEEYVSKPPDPDNNAFFDDGVAGAFNSNNVPGEGWVKAYLQKDPDNIWQATNGTPNQFGFDEVVIDTIDWGDNLESVDWYTRSQVRTEVVLFKTLTTPVLDYEMRHTSGWGIDEVHGLGVSQTGDPILGEGTQATVYSNNARFTIQKLNVSELDHPGVDSLVWVAGEGWTGDVINDPIFNGAVYEGGDGPGYYSAEINVKGRIIYGYTWNVRQLNEGPGYYRLTFSFDDELTGAPTALNTFFRDGLTNIALPLEEETETVTPLEESDDGGSSPDGGGIAMLDFEHNLTYIDIRILEREGGGMGGGNGSQSDSLSETITDFGAIASEMTGLATSPESSLI